MELLLFISNRTTVSSSSVHSRTAALLRLLIVRAAASINRAHRAGRQGTRRSEDRTLHRTLPNARRGRWQLAVLDGVPSQKPEAEPSPYRYQRWSLYPRASTQAMP